MPDDIRSLIREHRAFYEVSPYYIMVQERSAGQPPATRRVHAGFDIDIYAERTRNDTTWLPPPDKYPLGQAELTRIARTVSQHATGSCAIEVIPAPATVVFDTRDKGKMEATFRLRIVHKRGVDQPAGPAEQRALEEVVEELQRAGFARR